MIKIQVAVLDDNLDDAQKVKKYFDMISNNEINYCCHLFDDDQKIIEKYDLYIIDIEMPNNNGLQVAQNIRSKYSDAILLLCSKRNDLVFESFKIGCFFFIRKDHFEDDMKFVKIRLQEYFYPLSKNIRIKQVMSFVVFLMKILLISKKLNIKLSFI